MSPNASLSDTAGADISKFSLIKKEDNKMKRKFATFIAISVKSRLADRKNLHERLCPLFQNLL